MPGEVVGWQLSGSRPEAYDIGVEDAGGEPGRNAYLRSTVDPVQGFGTLMQTVLADDYRGRRIRLAASVKGDAISSWAGLWMRVDGPANEMLAFDNMQDRALRGTFGWRPAEIVLLVPGHARAIAFGILLGGSGEVRLKEVRFEPVSQDIPLTGTSGLARQPRNLNFADQA